jgi:hypothetical protein
LSCRYFSISTCVRSQHPSWSDPLEKRRFTLLLGLILAVIAIKISEYVFYEESGALDKAIMLYIHTYLPNSLNGIFTIINSLGHLSLCLSLLPFAIQPSVALAY